MDNTHFWNGLNYIQVLVDNYNSGDLIKITNIKDHIFLLTSTQTVYHGNIETAGEGFQLKLVKLDIHATDLSCSADALYVVESGSGSVIRYSSDLQHKEEIHFRGDDTTTCPHGNRNKKKRVKVKYISVSDFGCLFVMENGQLWAFGDMPQIGINSSEPRRVTFFNGRFVHSVVMGHDFAAALVRKHTQISFEQRDSDTDDCSEDVFVISCPKCNSTNSSSQSLDVCPLGLSLKSTESPSTSSLTDSSEKKHDAKTDTSDTDECDEKKNIIFRNTEAAREFLTRQFSWMSAGEEYLAECTEGPTRMIKQNVSNVASLVYEGVKTVGDKVVTLSRHVSGGSSDTNDVLEAFEEIYSDDFKQIMSNLNSSGKFDEFPWSSSTDTSEKEYSERGILNRVTLIVKTGSMLLNTEVWTWGNTDCGQLGLGDTMKRSKPTMVGKLSSIGVQKLVCGRYHCAALTLDGRAFIWGRNNSHQVLLDTTVNQSAPKQFLEILNDRIHDIACGDVNTVLQTHNLTLHFMGKHLDGNTEKLLQLETENKNTSPKKGSPYKNKVIASGMISCATCILPKVETREMLNQEQQFLETVNLVNNAIVKQFQKRSDTFITIEINIYETLCRCYSEILYFTAANVLSLIEFMERDSNSVTDVIMVRSVDEHITIYRNYLNALCDVIALGGFDHIAKFLDIPQHVYTVFSDLFPQKKLKKSNEIFLSLIFQHPLTRLDAYKSILSDCSISITKWVRFIDEQEKRLNEADTTRLFWETSGKVVELLRSPERRLIRESRSNPILVHNGGRFSSHWFVLLTDVFVHLNGTTQTVHPLPTLWVEPLQDAEHLQNALLLITPEDNLTLHTTSPQFKVEWLQALQNAIKFSLKKTNPHQQPPALRNASYVFQKHSVYKDAKYTGHWFNGKMHGAGKLEWPDGKVFGGQFQNNVLNGYARLNIPNVGVYEGQVKDNLQNGTGVMRYISGDLYEGQFKDGVAHGHGILKQGHFMSNSPFIYIGEWVNGVRQGYGVIDNIAAGEKYLGNWVDNKKHDCGVIVTLDGIYYEGVFNQDSLTGHGIMIFEDGTHYEGEFRAAGIFSGKGTLFLSSGDKIEGTLNGAWNEGVKISNATLHMNIATAADNNQVQRPGSFGKLCVPPNQKWKAIFKHCYQLLNVSESMTPDVDTNVTLKVWQNVAVCISNFKQNMRLQRNVTTDKENVLDCLDTIPMFGRDDLTFDSFNQVRLYLQKAFDCIYHPLGVLLKDVTTAYNATYGGVRVHPLLLNHAVAELRSIIDRMYHIVRLLFPALPHLGKEFVFKSDEDDSEVVNATSLLHPILLPRVHSALFVLYALHHKSEDDAYWKRLLQWNKQPDDTLMAFLGIDKKFWSNGFNQEPLKEQIYHEAIIGLQQLKTTFSPLKKLQVLRETFRQVNSGGRTPLGRTHVWTMDELFPIFHFIVVRARILQLGSEIHFIEDFMESYLENGELGIMFTMLKACYYQILQEKINIAT